MIMNNFISDVPFFINVTLYKNNYYDNKILSLIKHKSIYVENNKNTLTITSSDLKTLIDENLKNTLDDLNNATPIEFTKNINSIYFLYEMIKSYSNLMYFTINISNDKNYTRVVTNKESNSDSFFINFDFKVVQCILDFPNHLDSNGLKLLNSFLRRINLFEEDKFREGPPYIDIMTKDFLSKIHEFMKEFKNEKDKEFEYYMPIINVIYELINPKIEQDNPLCLLILDYPN